MSKEILSKLEEIAQITDSIYHLYLALIFLDTSDKMNLPFYKDLMQTLQDFKDKEKDLYEYFAKDLDKAKKAHDYLISNVEDDVEPDYLVITYLDETELMQKRIINHLEAVIYADPVTFMELIDEKTLELLNETDENSVNYLYEITPVEDDQVHMRLADFLDYFRSEQHHHPFIEKYLISAKYFLAFLNSHLEDYFLGHNFQIKDHSFEEDINIEFDGISSETVVSLNDDYGYELVEDAISSLYEISDDDLKNYDELTAAYILASLINVGLLFLSEDSFEELKDEVNDDFQKKEFIEEHPHVFKVKQMIDEAFKNKQKYYDYANQDFFKNNDFDKK